MYNLLSDNGEKLKVVFRTANTYVVKDSKAAESLDLPAGLEKLNPFKKEFKVNATNLKKLREMLVSHVDGAKINEVLNNTIAKKEGATSVAFKVEELKE